MLYLRTGDVKTTSYSIVSLTGTVGIMEMYSRRPIEYMCSSYLSAGISVFLVRDAQYARITDRSRHLYLP